MSQINAVKSLNQETVLARDAEAPRDAALAVRGLVKTFASFRLGPVNLTVPRGAFYGLIGPNGAGKSTIIDLVMGMGSADSGGVTVFGFDHARDEVEAKRRIGYVSPALDYDAWGRIDRLIKFIRPYYPTWDDAYCEQLLTRFDLITNPRIPSLSLGQRTRLALVIALAHRPELLLLDEPTTGLDAVAKHQMFEEIMALMEDGQHTTLISSHNLTDLERFTDHLGILDRGQMLLEGSTDELLARYRVIDVAAGSPLAAASELAHFPGAATQQGPVRLLRRRADRCRLLIDRTTLSPVLQDEAESQFESPLTLEELFVALIAPPEIATSEAPR